MAGREELAARLAAAGFVAADEEATLLVGRAGDDADLLETLVARRLEGEPLAWICGSVTFCGLDVRVDPGVYVPRPHSEAVARRAADGVPERGAAVDVCCGSGALAAVVSARRPAARVVGLDLDERAVACARSNGVEAYAGDLFEPLPADLRGRLDVVVGVVPYVPTPALGLLQRDTFTFETSLSYDGGQEGAAVLGRVATEARGHLRPGGALLLELGGDQAGPFGRLLADLGWVDLGVIRDEEGDVRGIEAIWPS